MQWPVWIYILVCLLVISIPGFVVSLLLARYFKVSQTGGFLISLSFVLLLLAIAYVFDRHYACPTTVWITVLMSLVSIRIGSKIGLRLRIKKLGLSHDDEDM